MQLVVFLLLLSRTLDGSDGASGWRSQDRKARPRHRQDDDVAEDDIFDCENVCILMRYKKKDQLKNTLFKKSYKRQCSKQINLKNTTSCSIYPPTQNI